MNYFIRVVFSVGYPTGKYQGKEKFEKTVNDLGSNFTDLML